MLQKSETGPAAAWKYALKTPFYPVELAGKTIGFDGAIIAAREKESFPMIVRRGVMQFISPLGSRAKLDENYDNHDFFTKPGSLRRPVGQRGDYDDQINSSFLGRVDTVANGLALLGYLHIGNFDITSALILLAVKGAINAVSHFSTDFANGSIRTEANLDNSLRNPHSFLSRILYR